MVTQDHLRRQYPSILFLVLKLALVGMSSDLCRYLHLTRRRNEQILTLRYISRRYSCRNQHGPSAFRFVKRHSHPAQTAPRVHSRTPFVALARLYVLPTCRTHSFAYVRYCRVLNRTFACTASPFALMVPVQNEPVRLRRRQPGIS